MVLEPRTEPFGGRLRWVRPLQRRGIEFSVPNEVYIVRCIQIKVVTRSLKAFVLKSFLLEKAFFAEGVIF